MPENNAKTGSIVLGQSLGSRHARQGCLRVLCDAPELERHVSQPWFLSYAAERLDLPRADGSREGPRSGTAEVDAPLLARHACVCGATGSGKTRLALHLLAEQLRAGCSVVMLDPKAETIRHLLHLAYGTGVSPEEVTLLSPHMEGIGAPGWNPLDCKATGLSPAQASADFVSVLAKSSGSWGPRLQDVLTNALIVISAHGLSLFELARLLQRDDYREGLLRQPLDPARTGGGTVSDAVVYDEARDYFLREFAAWGKSERTGAVAPVLNKFRELLRSPFLRSLLCARRSTLDLSSLWKRRGLVLVHLDGASLGDEGARLLGGLLAHGLLRTAMRASGPVPVVLALDEMGVAERFVGSAACARSSPSHGPGTCGCWWPASTWPNSPTICEQHCWRTRRCRRSSGWGKPTRGWWLPPCLRGRGSECRRSRRMWRGGTPRANPKPGRTSFTRCRDGYGDAVKLSASGLDRRSRNCGNRRTGRGRWRRFEAPGAGVGGGAVIRAGGGHEAASGDSRGMWRRRDQTSIR